MFDFTDQVAIVTGAAGSLGEATARAFHRAGAKMVLVDNREDRLEKVFADILDTTDCLVPAIDITDPKAVEKMVGNVAAHYGRVDILVNIAGGFRMGTAVHETPLETWEFMLNLNARSVFLACRVVIPGMLAQGRGKIINIGARAALAGRAKMAPYIASKSAVIRLTESMADELKHHGINVNCILPGTIDTPRNRADMPDADYSKWVPLEELTNIILFLASDMSRAINGASIPVYGRS
ncbi:MAG: SDR family NAD(P)-dependent oxidoreductase [Anaerolineae bacterium]